MIGGRTLRLRFTFSALSRLEASFGSEWMQELTQAISKIDAPKIALIAECASEDELLWITPRFAAGRDQSLLLLVEMINGALRAAFSGPADSSTDTQDGTDEKADGDWIAGAYRAALELGIGEQFWSLTPHQFRVSAKAAAERMRAEQRLVLSAGWLAAALQRAKQIPPLDEVLGGSQQAPAAPQYATPDDAVAAFKAAFSGGAQ